MKKHLPRVLLQGIGNPSRGDDALGPIAIERLAAATSSLVENLQFEFEWVYQLQVENAEQWSHFDVVVVIDAQVNGSALFDWRELKSSGAALNFSTHQLSPEVVLGLAQEYFQPVPRVFLLGIHAEKFELGESMSPATEAALEAALDSLPCALEDLFGLTTQAGPSFNI
jgi:hydrogenase maturation protease